MQETFLLKSNIPLTTKSILINQLSYLLQLSIEMMESSMNAELSIKEQQGFMG